MDTGAYIRVTGELSELVRRWRWGKEETIRQAKLLEELAHLGGYSEGYLYQGFKVLAQEGAIPLIVAIAKKQGGVGTYNDAVGALEAVAGNPLRNHEAIKGLQDLSKSGDRDERRWAIEALRRVKPIY